MARANSYNAAARAAAHLVAPDALVPVDEVLADHELVGVHHVQQLPAKFTVGGAGSSGAGVHREVNLSTNLWLEENWQTMNVLSIHHGRQHAASTTPACFTHLKLSFWAPLFKYPA